MRPKEFISVADFCASYNISHTLIVELKEYELVRIVEEKKKLYIPLEELPKTEKILRLHSDLEINLAGVEVITQLLDRMDDMQDEMRRLRNRLRLYE